ncbi:MAG: hypothetical protein IJH64_14455 [Oscillospiraceae bacterium]|nr:hypothetical protein [Oscillospiraceae bacterium]
MILSVSQRKDEDQRALGELFYLIVTELEDITFNRSMMILVEAMFQSVKSVFQITDEQLELFAEDFYNRLPVYMQKALDYTPKLTAQVYSWLTILIFQGSFHISMWEV